MDFFIFRLNGGKALGWQESPVINIQSRDFPGCYWGKKPCGVFISLVSRGQHDAGCAGTDQNDVTGRCRKGWIREDQLYTRICSPSGRIDWKLREGIIGNNAERERSGRDVPGGSRKMALVLVRGKKGYTREMTKKTSFWRFHFIRPDYLINVVAIHKKSRV